MMAALATMCFRTGPAWTARSPRTFRIGNPYSGIRLMDAIGIIGMARIKTIFAASASAIGGNFCIGTSISQGLGIRNVVMMSTVTVIAFASNVHSLGV